MKIPYVKENSRAGNGTPKESTLCWNCKRGVSECLWLKCALPVKGWNAEKNENGGYRVFVCPDYTDEERKDEPPGKTAELVIFADDFAVELREREDGNCAVRMYRDAGEKRFRENLYGDAKAALRAFDRVVKDRTAGKNVEVESEHFYGNSHFRRTHEERSRT